MTWMEEIAYLMNAYPPLWFLYVLVVILPFVLIVSYFLWPKSQDEVARRKKTDISTPDDSTPDDKVKEVVRDSGIEASGEADQEESEIEISPSTVEKMSQVEHETKKQVEEPHSIQNGVVEIVDANKGQEEEREEELEDGQDEKKRWSFPPLLEEFDLMTTDKDPVELEDIFSDERLKAVKVIVEDDGPSLGITIVGGSNSPSGDLPLFIKRVVPGSLADMEGTIKSGDELVAVNETLLTGVEKSYAVKALSNLEEGEVRLLILQDD